MTGFHLWAALAAALAAALLSGACGDDIPKGTDVDASLPADAAAADGTSIDAAPGTPAIASVDYPVIAHSGQLILTGTNLDGTTEVSIGGVVHSNLVDVGAENVTVEVVSDQIALGAQDVVSTSGLGASNAFGVTVIHLVINEIDPDTPGADAAEFIELDTGVAQALSLDGYVIALFNGNSAMGNTLNVIDLNAETAATGLLLVGPATLAVAPQVLFDGPIQAGEDGAAVYQFSGVVVTFPATFGDAGVAGLLDAVIWESNDDADSAALAPLLVDGTVIDEGATSGEREAVSIVRCPRMTTPRTGASFALAAPTAGVANAACP